MADPEEGNNPKPVDTTARQRLKDLRWRWGCPYIDPRNGPPEELKIDSGGKKEVWRRVGGPSGEATLYELERA